MNVVSLKTSLTSPKSRETPSPVMRHLIKIIALLLLLSGIGLGAGGAYLWQWVKKPLKLSADEVIIEVPKGTTLKDLARRLSNDGVIDRAEPFWVWVRLTDSYRRFQAGKYRFTGAVTPAQVIESMMKGDVFRPVVLSFTIPEGFTAKQISERLVANGVGHIKEFQRLIADPEFAKSLNIPGDTLEGYLYPATYQFTEMPSAPEVLRHMVQTFWDKLPTNYLDRLKEVNLSLHQAVTFASLIELETKYDDERPLVAEVIWNRLKKNMTLGIDAAIIYGIPDYDGDIRWKHLRDAANPYNLRIHKGLPPSPIGSPSAPSLLALFEPAAKGNYYYVLLPDSDRHHFSKTLKEHEKYVRKLIDAAKRPSNGL